MQRPSSIFKKRIAARFDRASGSYESEACVQIEIAKRVANLIRSENGAESPKNQLWCDFGSGSGTLLEQLKENLPGNTQFVCLDLSFAMLRRAMQSKRAMLAVNSDIDFLPIRPGVLHGATTVSVLQWLPSPQGALRNIAQTLKPGGVFYFSIFVDGSFTELIEAKSRMGLSQAIWLPTADELPAIFNKAGFNIDASICGIEHFKKTLTFPNALSALKSLSDIGATAISGQPLGRRGLDELCGNYTSMFSENGSDVLLTYHAVIGRACLKSK